MFLRFSFYVLGLILLLFCGMLLIGVVPRLLFGVRFLPSQDWVVRAAPFANNLGIAFGTFASALVIAARLKHPESLEQPQFKRFPKLKFLAAIFVSGFLTWFSCFFIVMNGIPMAQAVAAGAEVFLPYTVEDPLSYRGRKCRSAMELADMPGISNHLCRVPDTLRYSLSKGDTVYAVGWGTSKGVFYTSITVVPAD